jgi:hypothetical protein
MGDTAAKLIQASYQWWRNVQTEEGRTKLLQSTATLDTEVLRDNPPDKAPEIFRERFLEITQGIINEYSNGDVKGELSKDRDRLMAAQLSSVASRSATLMAERQKAMFVDQLNNFVDRYALAEDTTAAQDALAGISETAHRMASQNLIGQENVEVVIRGRFEDARTARVQRLASELRLDEAEAYFKGVKDHLSPDKVLQLEGQLGTARHRKKQLDFVQNFSAIADIERRIDESPFNIHDNEIIQQPGVDEEKALSLLNQLRASRLREAKKGIDVSKIQNWVEHRIGIPPDWRDPDVQKAAEFYVAKLLIPTLAARHQVDPERVRLFLESKTNIALADTISALGFMPETIGGVVRGYLRVGSPEQAANTADFVARIEETNPRALQGFTTDQDNRFASMVRGLMRAGQSPIEAVGKAKGAIYAVQPDVLEERKRFMHSEDGRKLVDTVVSKHRGGLLGFGKAEASDEVRAAAKQLLDAEFFASGDSKLSVERASVLLSKRYNISSVGGKKRLMAFPPEVIFGVAGMDNSRWMQAQLEEDFVNLKAQIVNLEGTKIPNPEPKRVLLESDDRTFREPNPTYAVFYKHEDDSVTPVTDNRGVQMRWRPDYRISPEHKAALDAANATIAKNYEAGIKQVEIAIQRRENKRKVLTKGRPPEMEQAQ